MMILHTCNDVLPMTRESPLLIWGQKVKVKFVLGSLNRFCTITSSPFDIKQGFFSVNFMAEIRLYSQWQIMSFFPNVCPKIPNSKGQKICCQTKVFSGIKASKKALLMPECKWNSEKESQGKGSEYNLDEFIMFVTHKFQHYQVYFAKKFPILSKTLWNSQFKCHGPCSQKSKKKPCKVIILNTCPEYHL